VTSAVELLRQGRPAEIWQKYCGFVDLSLAQFMDIQKDLLLEQLDLLGRCELGRMLLCHKTPAGIEEFRQTTPLTTYADYAPYLTEQREDILPEKPVAWARTSCHSGDATPKWVPYSRRMYDVTNSHALAMLIFGSSPHRGEFVFEIDDTILSTLAPRPYFSGAVVARGILDQFPFRYIPPLDAAEQMDFQSRINEGFKLALKENIDVFYGISSVLVKVGQTFEEHAGGMDISSLLHPRALLRVGRALLKSKLAHRPMLPSDLWPVKAIACGGTDTAIYRQRIEQYWGRPPVEAYGGTEFGVLATQTWGQSMTFFPDASLLEFIPEDEHIKSREDPRYVPRTVMLDELVAGGVYEIVMTNFHGGIFVRYRIGDLIKITALRDEANNIAIPQMVFYSRADDVIDLASFVRLTETTIGWALEHAHVGYVEWAVIKEVRQGALLLHFYIEPKAEEHRSATEIADAIDRELRELDEGYRDLHEMLGWQSPDVTLLARGTYQRFALEKQAAGAELAHLKPMRMKPSDDTVRDLLRLSGQ
jgi:hypothetical protein